MNRPLCTQRQAAQGQFNQKDRLLYGLSIWEKIFETITEEYYSKRLG